MGSKITFYGHATIGIETGEFHLIVDPYFKGNDVVTIKLGDVKTDYLLVTHGHGDHLGDAIEISGQTGAKVIDLRVAGRTLVREASGRLEGAGALDALLESGI